MSISKRGEGFSPSNDTFLYFSFPRSLFSLIKHVNMIFYSDVLHWSIFNAFKNASFKTPGLMHAYMIRRPVDSKKIEDSKNSVGSGRGRRSIFQRVWKGAGDDVLTHLLFERCVPNPGPAVFKQPPIEREKLSSMILTILSATCCAINDS